ncbi:MAG: diguanylate cyclase [Candidatus Eremiobacteraeota bacterium]|nr:diguanylate cyclase [Candidatus Eremiobacteraeota bacterium]
MKLRIFVAILAPYLLILLLVSLAMAFSFQRVELALTATMIKHEYSRLVGELETIVTNQEEYDAKLAYKIRYYKVGSLLYAWLMGRDGREVAFSEYRKNMEPQRLIEEKETILPYVKAHLPSGEKYLEQKNTIKVINYCVIEPSDFVLIMVAEIPRGDLLSSKYVFHFWIVVLFLFLVGFIWSYCAAGLLSSPLSQVAAWSAKASAGSEEKPPVTGDPDLKVILFSLGALMAKLHERTASDLNQVTSLPGNATLEKMLFDTIDTKRQFAVGAVDINNFSSFNHRYGFKKGDALIRFLSTTIWSALKEKGEKDDFLAHLGGDRFVFITFSESVEEICKAIIRDFDDHVPLYYDEADRKRGFVLSKNRLGEINKFSFVSLSIGIATNRKRPLIHPLQIAHINNEIKEYLKKIEGSSFLVDRRIIEREGPFGATLEEAAPEESGEQTAGQEKQGEDPGFGQKPTQADGALAAPLEEKKTAELPGDDAPPPA